jgi:hypothetical protein
MDIDNLRLYLKDEILYQDTTKEIFLNEIESIFEAHKNSEDTELIIYNGKCAGTTCENCGKQGYRFVGNKSKNYIDLLFEMNGDDITDIYSCAHFNTFDEIDKLGTKAEVEINLDDQASYVKTPEYWAKVYAATTAWSEIITTPPRVISYKELCYWIDKNAVANSLIGSFDLFDETEIMKWTHFSILYAGLKKIRSYISNHIEEFRLAICQSKKIQTEQDLVDWIVKYEDIYEEATSDLKYYMVKEKESFRLFPRNPILIHDLIFEDTFSFLKYFQDHFDDIFVKYSTYIDEDNSILFNTGGVRSFGITNFSLKFHLAHRKSMEELGMDVPFYLKKREYIFGRFLI